MPYTAKDHTFVICAYQENPFLEDCIMSVVNQTVHSNIIISTSTPNEYIAKLAEKYDLPLICNPGRGTAVDNMNFAYTQAETPLVTLCHQDDYYCPDYLDTTLKAANQKNTPIIIFTDYFEDRDGKKVDSNRLLFIKRCLNFPLRFSLFQSNKWLRRRILSLGSPICCPSVCFCKTQIPEIPFRDIKSCSWDWEAWIRLSALDGAFVYCPHKLMAHRIWADSATTETISNGVRDNEDYEILSSLWPKPLAKVIFAIYRRSQSSNM